MKERRASREMWPIGAVVLLMALLAAFFLKWALAISLYALFAFNACFFRDPKRVAPSDANAIVSPADGKVVEIKRLAEEWFQKRETNRVAIFLSVFDVHVNRAPIGGAVKYHQHFSGKFFDARNPACSAVNESQVIGIADGDCAVTVKLIAGVIARRIVNWCAAGDRLERGERIGMIRYGSRVELFLPLESRVTVNVGDRVKGGETILGYRK